MWQCRTNCSNQIFLQVHNVIYIHLIFLKPLKQFYFLVMKLSFIDFYIHNVKRYKRRFQSEQSILDLILLDPWVIIYDGSRNLFFFVKYGVT